MKNAFWLQKFLPMGTADSVFKGRLSVGFKCLLETIERERFIFKCNIHITDKQQKGTEFTVWCMNEKWKKQCPYLKFEY